MGFCLPHLPKWGMLAQTIACITLTGLFAQAPRPPEVTYDAQRNVMTYSTGDVRTAGFTGYGARYELHGKTPSAPTSISLLFGGLHRVNVWRDGDQAALHWNGVTSIYLTFNGKTLQFPAVHKYNVSKNRKVALALGRALEESMSITLTPAQFKELATTDSIQVQLGRDTQLIRGKSLGPLKRLAACIP